MHSDPCRVPSKSLGEEGNKFLRSNVAHLLALVSDVLVEMNGGLKRLLSKAVNPTPSDRIRVSLSLPSSFFLHPFFTQNSFFPFSLLGDGHFISISLLSFFSKFLSPSLPPSADGIVQKVYWSDTKVDSINRQTHHPVPPHVHPLSL